MKTHPKFTPGDQVNDLTFDPPLPGTIINIAGRPDSYYVMLDGAANEVMIHARNLSHLSPAV